MPKTRERYLSKLAARRAEERRRHQRERIMAGVIGAAVTAVALGAVYFAFLKEPGRPAVTPTPRASATPSLTPSPNPSPTGRGPGAACGYVQSGADTGPTGPVPIPEFTIAKKKTYTAAVTTSMGTFRMELFDREAPCAVNSFVYLARRGYYDGLTFHRVVKDFVIQGGDPTGTGSGGPGYTFNDELDNDLAYGPGTLAMANSGPHTNGSQWFVVVSESGAGQLQKLYTIFGKVIEGLDVVEKINAVPTVGGEGADRDMPVEPVTIETIKVRETNDQT